MSARDFLESVKDFFTRFNESEPRQPEEDDDSNQSLASRLMKQWRNAEDEARAFREMERILDNYKTRITKG